MSLIFKKKLLRYAAMIMVCGGFSLPAYGYIDPGTGSLIIQSIIGAIAAIGVTMKLYWHKIKVYFMGRKASDIDEATAAEQKAED
jgi:hypothetical protein